MWFGILEATLLGNMLARKGIVTAGYGNKLGKEMVRAGYGSKKNLIPPYHLTNIETQSYYQNESRYNGVYSRDNLSKNIKDGAYVLNLDECGDVGTQWFA